MGKCLIFCAAEFDALAAPVAADDYILAADGGLRHVEKLKLNPHGIIGDFDSLGHIPAGAEAFPVEKDDTDAMLAARKGLELGFREFWFYGSLDGPRLDHTVSNFQTLQFLADRGAAGYLIGNNYIVTVIKEECLEFPEQAQGILSLFCLGSDAEGITLENLHYPLQNERLTSGFPLGVSNHFTGKAARIHVEKGSILAMWDRKNGFPKR
ncbi:MAG: thiamine diphosphokinase [Oscillospiraceae bacterium]|nr:thiamine diphosphokinase [Oscillospiraceae bacterium]